MLFTFFVYCIFAWLLSHTKQAVPRNHIFKLWSIIFSVYAVYTIISDSYVENPLIDFFISRDQLFFYKSAIDSAQYSFSDIFKACFFNPKYGDLPLSIVWFAYIAKIGQILDVGNILLFEKLNVAFIGSLISVFIYKIVLFKVNDSYRLYRQILWFALLSPILILSSQLLRDIHICFLYTVMLYFAIKPICKYRYLFLLLLAVIIFFFRVENGLFSVAIIMIPLYQTYKEGRFYVKFILILSLLVFIILASSIILGEMIGTINKYNERSILAASGDSLGVKLNNLPFPLGNIVKTIFGQLLPFPFWVSMSKDEPYAYLHFVELLFPMYWIAILLNICLNIKRIVKEINCETIMIFISFVYLILCTSGEINTRRFLAVYPIIFCAYIFVINKLNLSFYKYIYYSIFLILGLHAIYIVLK